MVAKKRAKTFRGHPVGVKSYLRVIAWFVKELKLVSLRKTTTVRRVAGTQLIDQSQIDKRFIRPLAMAVEGENDFRYLLGCIS